MTSIRILDPAWTECESGGVALLTNAEGRWRCAGLSPSYGQFLALVECTLVYSSNRRMGSAPDVPERHASERAPCNFVEVMWVILGRRPMRAKASPIPS